MSFFTQGGGYPPGFFYFYVPGYILVWLLSGYFNGAYDKPLKFSRIFRGIAIGTVIILVAYALLPENLRFSRAIILLGSVWAIMHDGFHQGCLCTCAIPEHLFRAAEKQAFCHCG